MKCVLLFAVLVVVYWPVESKSSPLGVEVYKEEYGQENFLICRVTGVHRTNLAVQLTKNDEEIPGAQSNLVFQSTWYFTLTMNVTFTPQGEKYACKVSYDKTPTKVYIWNE